MAFALSGVFASEYYFADENAVVAATLQAFFEGVGVVLHPFCGVDVSYFVGVGLATEVAKTRTALGDGDFFS